ncbi:MAG: TIGR02757 family protein [Nitrospinae bacterium]|nr:TIGR02757 family protein [Nitrospinota bacterium]
MIDPSVIKPHLDRLLKRFNKSYLAPDPLAAALEFDSNPADLEVSCLIAGVFAYGRADLIQRNVHSILRSMDCSPAEFCDRFAVKDDGKWMRGFSYRFNKREDLSALIKAIGSARRKHGSLKALFLEGDAPLEETILPGLTHFVTHLRRYSGRNAQSFNTLLADPSLGGASKRWNLFLRWLVRKDGVDPGPWHGAISTARLVIPLDTHVGRIARQLGMLDRNANDWKAALELTRFLRKLDPQDPVKYDFAICSYGKLGYCVRQVDPEKCRTCDLDPVCSRLHAE